MVLTNWLNTRALAEGSFSLIARSCTSSKYTVSYVMVVDHLLNTRVDNLLNTRALAQGLSLSSPAAAQQQQHAFSQTGDAQYAASDTTFSLSLLTTQSANRASSPSQPAVAKQDKGWTVTKVWVCLCVCINSHQLRMSGRMHRQTKRDV